MMNILDINEKKKVLVEYRLRLAIVSIFAFGALVLSSSFLLIPPYVFSISKYNNAQDNIDVLEQKYGDSTREKEIATQIRDVNEKVVALALDNSNSVGSPLMTITKILNIKTDLIKLNGINYDTTGSAERIVLSGVALTRDGLAAFVDELKKEPTFTNVVIPISSYVKSININFSIVIDGASRVVGTKKTPPKSSPSQPF